MTTTRMLTQDEEAAKLAELIDERISEQFPDFLCPITKSVMNDPAITAMGISYEMKAIAHWLETHDTCPLSNTILDDTVLTPNFTLKKAINAEREKIKMSLIEEKRKAEEKAKITDKILSEIKREELKSEVKPLENKRASQQLPSLNFDELSLVDESFELPSTPIHDQSPALTQALLREEKKASEEYTLADLVAIDNALEDFSAPQTTHTYVRRTLRETKPSAAPGFELLTQDHKDASFLWAVRQGNIGQVKYWIHSGARKTAKSFHTGYTAAILAINNNDFAMLEYLCNDLRINVNENDIFGNSALYYAIEKNSANAAKLLLSRGAYEHSYRYAGRSLYSLGSEKFPDWKNWPRISSGPVATTASAQAASVPQAASSSPGAASAPASAQGHRSAGGTIRSHSELESGWRNSLRH